MGKIVVDSFKTLKEAKRLFKKMRRDGHLLKSMYWKEDKHRILFMPTNGKKKDIVVVAFKGNPKLSADFRGWLRDRAHTRQLGTQN